MTLCWLALVEVRPEAADVSAQVDGGARWLAAWHADDPPAGVDARRVDPRIIDSGGAVAWVSLVLPPRGAFPLFDDGAVQGARRSVLADSEPADLVTTLLVDDRHFAGALTARRGEDARRRLADDPFARVDRGSTRVLHVGPGLLGTVAPPPGPVIERHGSAVPWPGGRF